jgi:hypothetical protein
MDRLEEQLKVALRREEPSANFTDRVMARIAQSPIARKQEKELELLGWLKRLASFFRPPQMKWAIGIAMACLLVIASIGLYQYRRHQHAIEIAEGEKAKEQVMLALRIASSKLNVAQKKVQESSER